MDYSRLRAAALTHGEDEEAVTVDTRALIDKVLARYSGEWTTLRELIQNAADAQATTVTVRWETLPSTDVPLPQNTARSDLLKHTLASHTLRRLVVQNDGQPFTATDWARLKRIAEGNPDETKIGAFGVGFYSVFADCEEPFVSSGSEAIAFYWKGNALFTRKLQLPADQRTNDTVFVLDYRNTTTPLPNLLSVSQFLATSLTFVALQRIEFWVDDYKILSLQKKSSPSMDVPISQDIETRTKEKLMKLARVDRTSAQLDATFISAVGWKPERAASKARPGDDTVSEMPSLRSFFSRLTATTTAAGLRGKAAKEEKALQDAISEDLTVTSTSTIFLQVTTGQIQTRVSADFSAELERATKKPPPKMARLSILTSTYDETVASESSTSANAGKVADVFSTVLPGKKPGGRIFIGFPTAQTTGAGLHISAPSVIPTVEREAIDLNARWVRTWNIEMLRAAGIMVRLAFTHEMSDLHDKIKRASEAGPNKKGPALSAAAVAKYIPEALHVFQTYTFGDSTPSSKVGEYIEEAFWMAFKRASIEVYSSMGVLPTTKVRDSSDVLAKFVSGIPVILDEMRSAPFIQKLRSFGLISAITVDDICQDLSAKALDKDQLHHFIAWAAKSAALGELDLPSKKRVLDAAVATISEGTDSGGVIALGSITNYLNNNKIPATLPIPSTTLPFVFTVNIPSNQLQALGWVPLEIVPWLRFLILSGPNKADDENLEKSSKFSSQVLQILSKNWENLSNSDKTSVVAAVQNMTVVPTKMGMKKPGESFFATVKLFDDLPTVQFLHPMKDKFLSALGVRKTVDLETIFTRLLNPAAEGSKKWSHVELIKYLASVREDIPASDMKKLFESKLCPAEAGPAGLETSQGTTELLEVSRLFEPKDSLRALKLPLLQWPGPPGSFRATNAEGRFLSALGLRPHPTVPELVDMMAGKDESLRTSAMTYFIANHHLNGYAAFDLGTTKKAILPLEGARKELVTPSSCYYNESASILGYSILRKDLHPHVSKFGVARDPPIADCIERLIARPPKDKAMATLLFGYFSMRMGDLGVAGIVRLGEAPIVPVTNNKKRSSLSSPLLSSSKPGTGMTFIRPKNCYLGNSPTYEDIFDFVDFGVDANAFLFKCGAKSTPTKAEIASLACKEPARLLGVMQSPDKYINLLRTLAEDVATLKRDKELFRLMRTSAWLLGSREILPSGGKTAHDNDGDSDDEAPIKHYQLARPSQIVILDDYISYRLFKGSLLCAPEEDQLEAFYMALGAETLGSKVEEEVRIGSHTPTQDGAQRLRRHVLERSKLFLYEFSKYKTDAIKRDDKWLEANLSVDSVKTVDLRRSLRSSQDGGAVQKSHTEKRSAASAYAGGRWVLYVAADAPADMYQVGQAICQLLLTRPSQQAYLFFEPFLKLGLLDLRARGYNVSRILRVKAAEARIAEEERRKALEEERQRIREREAEWERQTAGAGVKAHYQTPEKPKSIMPGSFEDSPEESPSLVASTRAPEPPKKGGGSLFSQLTRRLGLDSDHSADDPLQSLLPNAGINKGGVASPAAPPPISVDTTRPVRSGGGGSAGSTAGAGGPPSSGSDDSGRVTSPAVIQENLLNAIQSARAHDSGDVFSPPLQTEVKEQATYCDTTTEANITFAGEAPLGTRVFIARAVLERTGGPNGKRTLTGGTLSLGGGGSGDDGDVGAWLMRNSGAIAQFEMTLREVGVDVFGMPPRVLHMFYDEVGSTIAFNSSGSIFCNLRFFQQLHEDAISAALAAVAAGRAAGGGGREGDYAEAAKALAKAKITAATWWWVVIAHELAHNLVGSHNAEHSYYTECFIQEYFGKMLNQVGQYLKQDLLSAPPPPSSSSSSSSSSSAAAPPPGPTPASGAGGSSSSSARPRQSQQQQQQRQRQQHQQELEGGEQRYALQPPPAPYNGTRNYSRAGAPNGYRSLLD